jgi:hypothetical protein
VVEGLGNRQLGGASRTASAISGRRRRRGGRGTPPCSRSTGRRCAARPRPLGRCPRRGWPADRCA